MMFNRKTYMKKWWKDHLDKKHAYNKKYRTLHQEQLRNKKHSHYLKRKEHYAEKHREWYKKNPNYSRQQHRQKREKLLERLGGKCQRCGFMDKRALQVDHVNGGGTRERIVQGTSKLLYKLLRMNEEELRAKYQILCANCNAIKEWERKKP